VDKILDYSWLTGGCGHGVLVGSVVLVFILAWWCHDV